MTRHCNKLGTFDLTGIPPAPRGVPQIEITFDIDANGILNVTALDKTTNKSNKIQITNDSNRLSKDEIEKMVRDAEKFKAEDDAMKEKIEAKNGLESMCFSVKSQLEEHKDKLGNVSEIKKEIEDTLEWLNEPHSIEEYKNKRAELDKKVQSVFAKMYGGASANAYGQQGGMPNIDPNVFNNMSQEDIAKMAKQFSGAQSATSGNAYGKGPTVEEVD